MWKDQLKLSIKKRSQWNCDATIAESGKNVENPGKIFSIVTIKFKIPKGARGESFLKNFFLGK